MEKINKSRQRKKVLAESLDFNQLAHANRVLMKNIVYEFSKKLGLCNCYRCGKPLEREDFTIDHIKNWRNNAKAKELFFDINNIAFSHFSCNTKAGLENRTMVANSTHGKESSYKRGCRCDLCREARKLYRRERRSLKKTNN